MNTALNFYISDGKFNDIVATFLHLHDEVLAPHKTLVFPLGQKHDVPDLPSEGTLGNFVAVLSSHTELVVQLGPGEVQVDGWGTAHHLCEDRKRKKDY